MAMLLMITAVVVDSGAGDRNSMVLGVTMETMRLR